MTKPNESNQPENEHHSSGSALNCLVRRERRLAAIRVTPEMMFMLLNGWKQNEYIQLPKLDWPTNARFISANWEAERQAFFMIFEHDSFPAVLEGDLIQAFSPELEIIKTPIIAA